MVLQVLPVVMATFTIAGPPVTMLRLTPGWARRALVVSRETGATVVIKPAGAPAETAAEDRARIASWQTLAAAGCGAKTTELPAASMAMALEMTVAAGLFEGVMAATTPKGAYSTKVRPLSPV